MRKAPSKRSLRATDSLQRLSSSKRQRDEEQQDGDPCTEEQGGGPTSVVTPHQDGGARAKKLKEENRAKEEEDKTEEEDEEQQATLATMLLRVTSPRSLLSAVVNIDSPLLTRPEWSSIYAIRFWDALNEREVDYQSELYLRGPKGLRFLASDRAYIVEQMLSMSWKLRLPQSTPHLAVAIMDRYLSLLSRAAASTSAAAAAAAAAAGGPASRQLPQVVTSSKLTLISLTSLLIAEKFDHTIKSSDIQHHIKYLLSLSGSSAKAGDISRLESFILATLGFDVNLPTSLGYLLRYVRAGELELFETRISACLLDRLLIEYDMLAFLPSLIAASVVLLVRTLSAKEPWTSTLRHYAVYEEEQLQDCCKAIQKVLRREEDARTSATLDPQPHYHHPLLVDSTHQPGDIIRHAHTQFVYGHLLFISPSEDE